MKKQQIKPTRSKFNILRQICNIIPQRTVSKLARESGAEDKSRTFSPWSHVVSQAYAQLTHSISLNDVCDSLQLNWGPLASVRVPFGFVMGPNTLEGEDIFNLARSKGEWIIIHKSYYL